MTPTTPGERLRAARRKAGLSAEDLGRKAGMELGRNKPISASAVRNQENGTNGIPIDTAQAYAQVLGVTPGYIVWGDDMDGDLPESAAAPATEAEQALWEELAIPAMRVISAAWLPMIIDSGRPSSDDHILVGLPGWNAGQSQLQAVQVIDKSLEPVFRRGTHLICAPLSDAYVFSGSYVLASWLRGEEIVHSIRRVFETNGALHLAPARDDSSDPWICIQEVRTIGDKEVCVPAEDYWIEGVVLASLHTEVPTGRPLYVAPRDDGEPSPDLDRQSIGELRRALRDEAWPARNLDFVGIRLREGPRKRRKED